MNEKEILKIIDDEIFELHALMQDMVKRQDPNIYKEGSIYFEYACSKVALVNIRNKIYFKSLWVECCNKIDEWRTNNDNEIDQ